MSDPFEFNIKDITQIKPSYDFKDQGNGRFEIYVDNEMAFTVRFGAFMDARLQIDRKESEGRLFMFLMNNYSKKTISHAIADLYDMGFPVDDWVTDYILHLINKSSKYSAMLRMLSMLKNFGDDDFDDYDSGSIDY
tara:strand:- start:1243 stop:1650 length:408 start_codon:yes stop_codon:yes gene_type:complete